MTANRAESISHLILCSGGVDSGTLAAQAAASGQPVELCFVDYGQPARRAEHRSVDALAHHFAIDVVEVGVAGLDVAAYGEVPVRNALLVTVAAALRPDAGLLYLGVHAGTGYRDCTPAFIDLMQGLLDFHTGGTTRLVAPFIEWTKADVYVLARELDLPIGLTHSCESSDRPCGECRSCVDREVYVVG